MNRIDGTSIFVEGKGIATIIDGEPAVQVAIRDISEQKRAAEALQKSEDQYRTLAEASNDLIFVIGRDDRVEYVNSFASALVNKTTDLIIGHPRSSLFPPEVARNQKTALDAVFDSGTLIRSEGALTFDGRIHWFDYVLTPVKNPDGRVRSVLGISRDITERKRVETALRESEARLRLLLDSTEDLIFMQDPDGRYLYFNSATRYGVLAEEMLGSTPFDFLDKETADRIMERLKNVAKTGQCIREEIPLVWKGQTFWFSDSLSPVRDVNGTITAVVTISQNITDRKHADIALRESEEKYRTLVDRANDVICVIQEGIIKMCNPRLTEFWGGSVEEMLGRPFTDFIHPDALSEVIDHYNRRMCGVSPPAVYETILMRKDGCRSFVELNAGIISYEGKPADLIIIRDMNDRKKIQDALRESEATARALINAPTDSVILMDSRGVILALNETAALRFGKRSDELVGILPDDLLPKEVARSRRSKVAQILEKKEMVRFEDERDGRWYDTVAYPVVSETGEVNKIAIIARDITDRRNADEALIHSEQRFRNLITAIADIVWETDSYARFVYVSPQVETILGYTADELIGHTPFEFLQPETISTNQKKFQTAVEKHERSVLHMSHWIHKDGHEILLESNAIPMYDSDGSFSGFIGIDRQRK